MKNLVRKIDKFLIDWKNDVNKKPLIIKGARQIGKTYAVRELGKTYESYIEINFILNNEYLTIFDNGYSIDTIIKNISLKNSNVRFVPGNTLIFFDEIQACVNTATALKSFNLDKRFDVVCSGSLMGINYKEIDSNSVGSKIDYTMRSMDFEEFLWAKGYKEEQIEDLYTCMKEVKPLSINQYEVMLNNFKEYMIVGGMPEIVNTFLLNNNYGEVLNMQKQIILDYEDDITKYAGGLDKTKILNVYRKILVFLGKDNKKFQITKVSNNARSRDYVGVVEWLLNAGIVNVSYMLNPLELPLKGNYDIENYRLYFADTGLLIATLEEEVQDDLRKNENLNTYKGAIYENIIGDMLVKSGYDLFYYRNDTLRIENDFIIRDIDSIVPIEVKANDNSSISLNKVIDGKSFNYVKYGIKLCNKNIGFNGKFYTFPYFLTFLLKRFMKEKNI